MIFCAESQLESPRSRTKDGMRTPRQSLLIALALSASVGCQSPSQHVASADQEVYALVEARRTALAENPEVFQLAESLRRGSYIGRPKLTGGRPRRLRRNCRTALYLSARAGSAWNSVRATKRTSQVLSRAAPSAARLRPGDHRGHAAACDGSRTRTAALTACDERQARTAAFNRKSLRRAPSSDRGE